MKFKDRVQKAADDAWPEEIRGDAYEGPSEPGALDPRLSQPRAPWPDLVRIGDCPEPPAFPLGVLPKPLARLATEIADALNCAVDMPAVIMLALAGGAIGAARSIKVKENYFESAALYLCVVAPPGGAKTPVMKLLRGRFDDQQEIFLKAFQERLAKWIAQDENGHGVKPVCERVVVADATVESLAMVLNENPRGVVMARDEVVSLVHGLNQYKGGKGADRQFYLSTWSGDSFTVDRKSDKERHGAPLFVSHPFLGIVGGIQPDVVAILRGERMRGTPPPNDGWLDRFLFSWPATPRAKGENWKTVSDAALADWRGVVDFLFRLEMVDEDGRKRPRGLRLSNCGKTAWEKLTADHAAELNDEHFPEYLVGPWAKLKAYGARFALIIHLLRIACEEILDADIDGESMIRAWKLVDYFKGHVRKVYSEMNADETLAGARRVVQWIEDSARQQFAERDAYQAFKGTYSTMEKFEPILRLVEERGYIRPIPEPEHKGPGRKPSPVYEVHPKTLGNDPHNSQNRSGAGNSENCGKRSRKDTQ